MPLLRHYFCSGNQFQILNKALVDKHNSRLRLFFSFVLTLSAIGLGAQDIHFSQFANSPLNLNPALAGVFGGDMRFAGIYRNQWRTVPVPYNTFSGSVENKVYWAKGRYDRFLTGALMLNYDRQGSLQLTSLQVGIPVSVTLPIARKNFLTVGVTPAFGQRAFDTHKVTFDEQFVDCIFSPNNPISENLANTSLKYFDLSAGANFRMQSLNKRSRLDLGAAIHHLNRPHHNFWSSSVVDQGNERLYEKTTLYAIGLLQLSNNFDLVGQGLFQRQGGYKEIVYGGGVRFHLNQKPYRELAIQVGADYRQRYNDALIPHLEVLYRTWTLGFTYDFNFWSQAGELVTNQRGGPEVSLLYRLYRVKPIPKFKSCPII